MLKVKHLIEPNDLTKEDLEELLTISDDIINDRFDYKNICKGYILATLFYEPSTRTKFSFESAMLRLGGNVIGFSEPNSTSVAKGESIADTIRIIGSYSDIIAMRHPKAGSSKLASMYSSVPVINAGDGSHNHPTQTLTDLLTIKSLKGRLDNLTIGICGDLKYGRTVHSLIKMMLNYSNIKYIFISPEELRLPKNILEELRLNNVEYEEVREIEESISSLDILYMTRIQKERFNSEEEYNRLKDCYILDKIKLVNAKEDMLIMHPLPRVNEIDYEVDEDSRAVYFKQAKYGVYVRMALILKLLGIRGTNSVLNEEKKIIDKYKCNNPKCITSTESHIKHISRLIDNKYVCDYCEELINDIK
jgi:aspartate carbamoyltransferase catalytic subunit